jgi:prephenate dehydrogenase
VVSNAYVKSPTALQRKGFSAGSYRDMTRVAKLNVEMWTELFLENRDFLAAELGLLIDNLQQYKDALDQNDEPALRQLLQDGKDTKRRAG